MGCQPGRADRAAPVSPAPPRQAGSPLHTSPAHSVHLPQGGRSAGGAHPSLGPRHRRCATPPLRGCCPRAAASGAAGVRAPAFRRLRRPHVAAQLRAPTTSPTARPSAARTFPLARVAKVDADLQRPQRLYLTSGLPGPVPAPQSIDLGSGSSPDRRALRPPDESASHLHFDGCVPTQAAKRCTSPVRPLPADRQLAQRGCQPTCKASAGTRARPRPGTRTIRTNINVQMELLAGRGEPPEAGWRDGPSPRFDYKACA